jgi:hypothetical protein
LNIFTAVFIFVVTPDSKFNTQTVAWEGHNESPGLPSALQLEQLTLEVALVVQQQAVCRYRVI